MNIEKFKELIEEIKTSNQDEINKLNDRSSDGVYHDLSDKVKKVRVKYLENENTRLGTFKTEASQLINDINDLKKKAEKATGDDLKDLNEKIEVKENELEHLKDDYSKLSYTGSAYKAIRRFFSQSKNQKGKDTKIRSGFWNLHSKAVNYRYSHYVKWGLLTAAAVGVIMAVGGLISGPFGVVGAAEVAAGLSKGVAGVGLASLAPVLVNKIRHGISYVPDLDRNKLSKTVKLGREKGVKIGEKIQNAKFARDNAKETSQKLNDFFNNKKSNKVKKNPKKKGGTGSTPTKLEENLKEIKKEIEVCFFNHLSENEEDIEKLNNLCAKCAPLIKNGDFRKLSSTAQSQYEAIETHLGDYNKKHHSGLTDEEQKALGDFINDVNSYTKLDSLNLLGIKKIEDINNLDDDKWNELAKNITLSHDEEYDIDVDKLNKFKDKLIGKDIDAKTYNAIMEKIRTKKTGVNDDLSILRDINSKRNNKLLDGKTIPDDVLAKYNKLMLALQIYEIKAFIDRVDSVSIKDFDAIREVMQMLNDMSVESRKNILKVNRGKYALAKLKRMNGILASENKNRIDIVQLEKLLLELEEKTRMVDKLQTAKQLNKIKNVLMKNNGISSSLSGKAKSIYDNYARSLGTNFERVDELFASFLTVTLHEVTADDKNSKYYYAECEGKLFGEHIEKQVIVDNIDNEDYIRTMIMYNIPGFDGKIVFTNLDDLKKGRSI